MYIYECDKYVMSFVQVYFIEIESEQRGELLSESSPMTNHRYEL